MGGLQFFAAQDPQTVLASGNILAILALIIVTLATVLALVTRYFIKKLDGKDLEIRDLNKLIYNEGKVHASDYKEMSNDYREVVQANSQNMALLGEKIEVVKGRR